MGSVRAYMFNAVAVMKDNVIVANSVTTTVTIHNNTNTVYVYNGVVFASDAQTIELAVRKDFNVILHKKYPDLNLDAAEIFISVTPFNKSVIQQIIAFSQAEDQQQTSDNDVVRDEQYYKDLLRTKTGSKDEEVISLEELRTKHDSNVESMFDALSLKELPSGEDNAGR